MSFGSLFIYLWVNLLKKMIRFMWVRLWFDLLGPFFLKLTVSFRTKAFYCPTKAIAVTKRFPSHFIINCSKRTETLNFNLFKLVAWIILWTWRDLHGNYTCASVCKNSQNSLLARKLRYIALLLVSFEFQFSIFNLPQSLFQSESVPM